VQNLLFVLLVSFAVRTSSSLKLNDFRSRLTLLLNGLKRLSLQSEEYDEDLASAALKLPWWDEFLDFIKEKMPDKHEELVERFSDFTEVVDTNEIEDLLTDGEIIRTEVLLENQESPTYSVKEVQATYIVRWADGQQAEYTCKPYKSSDAPFGIQQLLDLVSMYHDQFYEVMLNPGLDTLHDQAAKPFDSSKFDELFRVLAKYVADMPGSDRGPYEDILSRIRHHFGEMQETLRPVRRPNLKFLKSSGGFQLGDQND
jgi:hypothetical protein